MKTINLALVGLLSLALPVKAQDYTDEIRAYKLGETIGKITCIAYFDGIRSDKSYTVYLSSLLTDAESDYFMKVTSNDQLLTLIARGVENAMDSVSGCGREKMRTVKGK